MIAYLGTGLLGAGFVQSLLRNGETVQVWNRSHDKAQALERFGATAFADPADAVRGAERVHVTLVDDATVDDVLERVRPGLSPNAIIIDHTTTSPDGTRDRVKRWAERGIRLLHAPVFMGPPNALNATGVMLASGDRALFDAVKPNLEKMTGNLVYLGEDPGRAAGMKLLGNHFLVVVSTGLSDTLSLARGLGIPSEEVGRLFEIFNPGAMVPGRMQRLLTVDYSDPSWTLNMARKDVRLMIEAAAKGGAKLVAAPALAAVMDEWIAAGHGTEDWAVITREQVHGA